MRSYRCGAAEDEVTLASPELVAMWDIEGDGGDLLSEAGSVKSEYTCRTSSIRA